MNVLVLNTMPLYPVNNGAKIRVWNLLNQPATYLLQSFLNDIMVVFVLSINADRGAVRLLQNSQRIMFGRIRLCQHDD